MFDSFSSVVGGRGTTSGRNLGDDSTTPPESDFRPDFGPGRLHDPPCGQSHIEPWPDSGASECNENKGKWTKTNTNVMNSNRISNIGIALPRFRKLLRDPIGFFKT